jgi:hypothetical protein
MKLFLRLAPAGLYRKSREDVIVDLEKEVKFLTGAGVWAVFEFEGYIC